VSETSPTVQGVTATNAGAKSPRLKRGRRSRHGLFVPMVKVKLKGMRAIDKRMAGARDALAFKENLVNALGGEPELSPQKRKLVELCARAALLLDAADAWILEQPSIVNARTRALHPAVLQRQALAEHLAKLLDRLGLERIPRKVPSLSEYVRSKYAAGTEPTPRS